MLDGAVPDVHDSIYFYCTYACMYMFVQEASGHRLLLPADYGVCRRCTEAPASHMHGYVCDFAVNAAFYMFPEDRIPATP